MKTKHDILQNPFFEILKKEEVPRYMDEKYPQDGWGNTLNYYQAILPDYLIPEDLLEIFPDEPPEEYDASAVLQGDTFFKSMRALTKYMDFQADSKKLKIKKEVIHTNANYNANDLSWRLHIDPIHQMYGPNAYNKGNSASDDEFQSNHDYLSNIAKAESFLSEALAGNKKLDLTLYSAFYKLVMAGSSNALDKKNFREILVTTRTGKYGNLNAERLQTVLANKEKGPLEYITEPLIYKNKPIEDFFITGVRGWYFTDQMQISQYLENCFTEYNRAMGKMALSDEMKITSIAKLYQDLESNHPYEDGNGRTNRALLNGLLKANKLGQTVLSDPACAHYLNLTNLVKEIKIGQKKYEFIQKLPDLSWQESNKKISAWEKQQGITLEYSLEFGEKLQTFWDKITKISALLDDLQDAQKSLETHHDLPGALNFTMKKRLHLSVDETKKALATCKNEFKTFESCINEYVESEDVKYQRAEVVKKSMKNIEDTNKENHMPHAFFKQKASNTLPRAMPLSDSTNKQPVHTKMLLNGGRK